MLMDVENLKLMAKREDRMTAKDKIEAIITHTGWAQKKIALKCGRDASAITRVLQGAVPSTKSFRARIDDLYQEVFDLKLWD